MERLFPLVLILLSCCSYSMADEVAFKDLRTPFLSISDAIAAAKTYAEKNDIDLQGKYIKRAEFFDRGEAAQCWSVLWVNEFVTKGGDVELRLCKDGTVKEAYYK